MNKKPWLILTKPQEEKTVTTPATHLSSRIIIMVNGEPVGEIQSIAVTEGMGIAGVDDNPLPPIRTTIDAKRIRFDRPQIEKAFTDGFMHVGTQETPFQIEIHDTFKAKEPIVVKTILNNVVIDSMSYTYTVEKYIIVDSFEATYGEMYSIND